MTPVILDHGRFDRSRPTIRIDRTTGQAGLVVLLAVSFLAILVARPSGGSDDLAQDPGGALGSAAASSSLAAQVHSVPPSVAPTAAATSEPGAPSASTGPSSPPPAASTPVPSQPVSSGRTYRVKSGDTLSAIAARFDTTTRVLVQLNDIRDPSKLKIGQILKLP